MSPVMLMERSLSTTCLEQRSADNERRSHGSESRSGRSRGGGGSPIPLVIYAVNQSPAPAADIVPFDKADLGSSSSGLSILPSAPPPAQPKLQVKPAPASTASPGKMPRKGKSILPPVTLVPPRGIGPIADPNPNDVLSGRGGRINAHPGNVQFRDLVQSKKSRYLSKETKKLQKAHIAAEIVTDIRSMTPPGRFLKEDGDTGLWWDIGDEKARKKCGQALREDAPDIRPTLKVGPGSDSAPSGTGRSSMDEEEDTSGVASVSGAARQEEEGADSGGSGQIAAAPLGGATDVKIEIPSQEVKPDSEPTPAADPSLSAHEVAAPERLLTRSSPIVTPSREDGRAQQAQEAADRKTITPRTVREETPKSPESSPPEIVAGPPMLPYSQRWRAETGDSPRKLAGAGPPGYAQPMSGRGMSGRGKGAGRGGGRRSRSDEGISQPGGHHELDYKQAQQQHAMQGSSRQHYYDASGEIYSSNRAQDAWVGGGDPVSIDEGHFLQSHQHHPVTVAMPYPEPQSQTILQQHHTNQPNFSSMQTSMAASKLRGMIQKPFREFKTVAQRTFSPQALSGNQQQQDRHQMEPQSQLQPSRAERQREASAEGEAFGRKFVPTSKTSHMSFSDISPKSPGLPESGSERKREASYEGEAFGRKFVQTSKTSHMSFSDINPKSSVPVAREFGGNFVPTSKTNLSISDLMQDPRTLPMPASTAENVAYEGGGAGYDGGGVVMAGNEGEERTRRYLWQMQQLRQHHPVERAFSSHQHHDIRRSASEGIPVFSEVALYGDALRISDQSSNTAMKKSDRSGISELSCSMGLSGSGIARSLSLPGVRESDVLKNSDFMSLGDESHRALLEDVADHEASGGMSTQDLPVRLQQRARDAAGMTTASTPSPTSQNLSHRTSSGQKSSSDKSSDPSTVSALSEQSAPRHGATGGGPSFPAILPPMGVAGCGAAGTNEEAPPHHGGIATDDGIHFAVPRRRARAQTGTSTLTDTSMRSVSRGGAMLDEDSGRSSSSSWIMRSMQSVGSDAMPWNDEASRVSMLSGRASVLSGRVSVLSDFSLDRSVLALDLAGSSILPPLPQSHLENSNDTLGLGEIGAEANDEGEMDMS